MLTDLLDTIFFGFICLRYVVHDATASGAGFFYNVPNAQHLKKVIKHFRINNKYLKKCLKSNFGQFVWQAEYYGDPRRTFRNMSEFYSLFC